MCVISMYGGPGGTGFDEVRFPVHACWDSRDVSVAGLCDCVKEWMSFEVHLIICMLVGDYF